MDSYCCRCWSPTMPSSVRHSRPAGSGRTPRFREVGNGHSVRRYEQTRQGRGDRWHATAERWDRAPFTVATVFFFFFFMWHMFLSRVFASEASAVEKTTKQETKNTDGCMSLISFLLYVSFVSLLPSALVSFSSFLFISFFPSVYFLLFLFTLFYRVSVFCFIYLGSCIFCRKSKCCFVFRLKLFALWSNIYYVDAHFEVVRGTGRVSSGTDDKASKTASHM